MPFNVHTTDKVTMITVSGFLTVGVSCGYTDYYQGRGHSIRLIATLINIHEHLI